MNIPLGFDPDQSLIWNVPTKRVEWLLSSIWLDMSSEYDCKYSHVQHSVLATISHIVHVTHVICVTVNNSEIQQARRKPCVVTYSNKLNCRSYIC